MSELVSEIDPQAVPVPQPESQPRYEQIYQPEIVSDTGSAASSKSSRGLSLEQDMAAGIKGPALIEDLPPESILGDPQEEEDLLDIPAFLRRQAN